MSKIIILWGKIVNILDKFSYYWDENIGRVLCQIRIETLFNNFLKYIKLCFDSNVIRKNIAKSVHSELVISPCLLNFHVFIWSTVRTILNTFKHTSISASTFLTTFNERFITWTYFVFFQIFLYHFFIVLNFMKIKATTLSITLFWICIG